MANVFSGDANCVALWRFESGALTTDSKGTNTLTDINTVGEDAVNYKEGACSADFEINNAEEFYILDANLDAGFPLKNGDPIKIISVCGWVKFESFASSSAARILFNKWVSGSNKRTFLAQAAYNNGSNSVARIGLGYNAGVGQEHIEHASALSLATWYHMTFTYDNSDKSYAIRIRDTNGNTVGTDKTGTATLDANKLNVEDAFLAIGALGIESTPSFDWRMDGLIDEVVVFKDIITAGEATQIALGTYGAAGGLSILQLAQSLGGNANVMTA